MTRPNAQSQSVLREFCSRFTSSLRDWFESLGEYRQLQLIQTIVATKLTVIYEQFIGEPAAANETSRKEFHQIILVYCVQVLFVNLEEISPIWHLHLQIQFPLNLLIFLSSFTSLHQICNRTKSVLGANSPQVLVSSRYTLIRQIPNPKIIPKIQLPNGMALILTQKEERLWRHVLRDGSLNPLSL